MNIDQQLSARLGALVEENEWLRLRIVELLTVKPLVLHSSR